MSSMMIRPVRVGLAGRQVAVRPLHLDEVEPGVGRAHGGDRVVVHDAGAARAGTPAR